ncbi:MAG: hypothetical protein GWO39_03950, partial [Gammaproteobacteria bacterium]|nr:hypothetical protein [Gammaproteobacteria bacterium]NIT62966.1 hypothetical protein [Gammaproteobacteria bacterium]NIV19902.1 hypothetical protein [Gammaproteobacteria bacterium]NIY31546.1 hypothetical protein [Gammaproteobacteria bacterium]
PEPEMGRIVAWLHAEARNAPLEMQESVHRALDGVLEFFQGLEQGDEQQVDAAVARINLATAN